MEAPWAYHYAGRPDRTAEVVHSALTWQFGTGPGGLPGNDDSGGLSSWYVWASLGLFPVAGQNLFLVNAPAFERARDPGRRRRVRHRDQRAPRDADRRRRHRPRPARPVRPVGHPQRRAAARRPTSAPPTSTAAAGCTCGSARNRPRWGARGPPARRLSDHPHDREGAPMSYPRRRLVIVVRADPVICGHSGEARNLAEVALTRGFDDVRLLTWPIADAAGGRPAAQAAGPAAARTARASPSSGPSRSATTGCRTAATWPASPAGWSSCSPSRCRPRACRCTWCRTPTW